MKYTFLLLSFNLFLFLSCQTDTIISDHANESKGNVSFSLDMSSAPDEVTRLKGSLGRADFDPVTFEFIIEQKTAVAIVNELAQGEWSLFVQAMNDSGLVLYEGSTTVTVASGQTNTVYLHLNPASGSLEIIVTWGEQSELKQPMLFMAQNEYDEWRVLMMNIDGSEFKDITSGAYPIWIENKNEIIFRSDAYSLAKINVSSNEYQIISSAPYLINYIRYSAYMNKIVFDFNKGGESWHIGHMNLDGSDFTEVITDDSWKKRPAPLVMSDWIFYQGNISGTNQLYKIKFDGSGNQQVTFFDSEAEASFPSFNKKGDKLLYSAKGNDFYYIIERSLNSGEEKVYNFSNTGEVIYPTYSVDENYIIYIVVKGPEYQDREMFLMKADGSEKRNITPNGFYYHFARPITW